MFLQIHIFYAFILMISWAVALLFLVLFIAFFKRRNLKLVFGGLTLLFILLPFSFSLRDALFEWDEEERLAGEFKDFKTGEYLILNDDDTWESNLFKTKTGEWEYMTTEDFDCLNFKGGEPGVNYLSFQTCVFSIDTINIHLGAWLDDDVEDSTDANRDITFVRVKKSTQ